MHMPKKFAVLASVAALGLTGCERIVVSQNESAIQTKNGRIVDENISPGGHWLWLSINKNEIPKISHTTQNATITVVDGQQCQSDCIPVLQTNNSLTVSGSLTAQWNVEREKTGEPSVMVDLYNRRGVTNVDDVREKLLMPAFRDCVITSVRKRSSYEVNEQGDAIKSEVKDCLQAAVTPFHITISHIFDNGFGPSPEARQSMARVANAKLEQDVAQAQLVSAPKRQEAAVKNAEIYGAEYARYKAAGVPDAQIPQIMCLKDPNSSGRPCITYTSTGLAVAAAH